MARMSVDPQRWAELNRLLDTALDLPPAERERWLETLDPSLDALKPELRDLLSRAGSVETRDFLNTLPKFEAATREGAGDSADQEGGCVGPYRLVREIGAGGMGTVWLAERTDESIRRPIALKLPHVASSRVGLAERMARERDILATLEHPNVARLYDAGVSPEGRPYLALEYVEGLPIDQYCRKRELDVSARLRLFLQVATAVAYAHAKLIIHRDLKPANILVTPGGDVRLLDFGVAKLLDDGRAESTRLTELSGRALTPDYASPEQIMGQPLTIATDVYSLGVVLYELLAQTRPYRLARESRGALEDAILQSDPPRPSDVAAPPERKALRGDLDTIALKALRKKPDERYATVNAFADDVVRHLQRLPVLARPQSAWYHLGRFVSRNRVSVGIAATAVIAVLAGAGIAVWQARVAVAEGRRAEEVRQFIVSIFLEANIDREQSRPASVLELLKQAGERVQTLDAEPAVRVELLNLIGSGLLSLDDTDALEAVVRRALDEGERSLGAEHPLTLRARALMLRVHMYRGRTEQMGAEIDALMKVMERDEQAFAEDLVELWRVRADYAIDARQYEQAEAAALEAVRRAEALFGTRHAETLRALGVLVIAYDRQGKHVESLRTAERARDLALELFPGNPLHPLVIFARAEYARALADTGQLGPAVEQLSLATRDAEKVYGPEGRTVGFHLQNLAGHQLRAGFVKAAIDSGSRSFNIAKRHAEPGTFTHAASLNVLGQALLAARRGEDALPIVTQTREAASRIFGPEHRNAVIARADHALALGLTGKIEEARKLIDVIVDETRRSRMPPARPFHIASELERLAGRHAQALERAQEALGALKLNGGAKGELARAQTQIGLARLELGASDAVTPLDEAIATFQEVEVEITPAHVDALMGRARLHLDAGRAGDALPLLQRADGFWRDFDAQSRWAGEASLWLGQCLLALGRTQEANDALRRARQILARSPIPNDAQLLKVATSAHR